MSQTNHDRMLHCPKTSDCGQCNRPRMRCENTSFTSLDYSEVIGQPPCRDLEDSVGLLSFLSLCALLQSLVCRALAW